MALRLRSLDLKLLRTLITVAAGLALVAALENFFAGTVPHGVATEQHLPERPVPIRLVFVGDIMMDRGVRGVIHKYYGGDYSALFSNTPYLQDADVAFANLEGTVGTGTTDRTSKFFFRMDPEALHAMRDAGFDVVSFANNHIGDFGQHGFESSLEYLQGEGILAAGAGQSYLEASTPRIITVRGVRVGFLAATDVGSTWMNATEHKAGIILARDSTLTELIRAAKTQVDILVVSFHFGSEYAPVTSRQEQLAHLAIDHGADIVVGHHPHVMQRIETYRGKPIFYSLGDYIFDQYFSRYTMEGMVATVTIDPETLAIAAAAEVSPLDRHFVPQQPAPFDVSMLLATPFTP